MINIYNMKINVSNQGHYTNTYIINDEKQALIIDPAFDYEKIINYIKENLLDVKYIVITHAHADHIGALEKVQKYTHAKVIIHKLDKQALLFEAENYSDMFSIKKQNIDIKDLIVVEDGFKFNLGNMSFEIIHTPGHTAGSICIYEENSKVLFSGDTIFSDAYGRCDLYKGNFNDMLNSLRKLFNKFSDIMIYPGHGEISNIDIAKKRIKLLIAMKGYNI